MAAPLSFFDRVLARLGSPALREALNPPAMGGLDADEALYRPLTARIDTMPAYQRDRMLALAAYLARENPVAHRLLDLVVDHVFASGLAITAKNAKVGDLLHAHWDDPVNRWDRRGPRTFRVLLRDGEVLLPAGVNAADGAVRWGLIPARKIKDVQTDPLNWEIATAVTLYPDRPGDPERTLDVIREGLTPRQDGEQALFWKVNADDSERGVSWLYTLADLLDLLKQSMWNDGERELLQKAFVWDVTLAGVNQNEVAAFAKDPQFAPPPPGSVRLHNEQVTWQAISPDLRMADSIAGQKFRLGFVLGSVGVPEHWYGFGGDVNRAVGTVMDDPTLQMLRRLQEEAIGLVTDALRFVVDCAVAAQVLPAEVPVEDDQGKATAEMIPAREAFTLAPSSEMNVADVQAGATAAQAAAAALTAAQSQDWVTEDTARRAFLAVLSLLGVDVDPDAEADAIQGQRKTEQQQPSTPPELARAYAQLMGPSGGNQNWNTSGSDLQRQPVVPGGNGRQGPPNAR